MSDIGKDIRKEIGIAAPSRLAIMGGGEGAATQPALRGSGQDDRQETEKIVCRHSLVRLNASKKKKKSNDHVEESQKRQERERNTVSANSSAHSLASLLREVLLALSAFPL